jgi:thiosulfate/3-mercaptopyruvate sulfurtransferase
MSLKGLFLLAIVALIPGATPAQGRASRAPLLVSTGWLAKHIGDRNLVLLHVGDKKEYEAAHIPGAHFISLGDISVSGKQAGGLELEMPATRVLHDDLAKLGISDKSRVIVYYASDRVAATTRVVFTLDYAGLGDRTSVLDGGMRAWTHDNHPVTATISPVRAGILSPLSTKPLIVDANWVRSHVGARGISVVDARAGALYDGTERGGGMGEPLQRAGHIAGARSIPYTDITNDDLKFKSVGELQSLFAKAGVKPGDTVVAYCHIGAQATGVLFAARMTGHPVLLYDGSFEDWSAHTSFPVDTKPTR